MTSELVESLFDWALLALGISESHRNSKYEKHEHDTRARLLRGENVAPEEVQEEPVQIPW